MINRFKTYLEREFRTIAPTREAMEYRKEVLGNLLDRAEEFRIKGMTDEDAIFNLCIDSLGDFRATLKKREQDRIMVQKAVAKTKIATLVIALSVVALVAIYIAVSFVTGGWAWSWLILVGGIFAGIISVAVLSITKIFKKNAKSEDGIKKQGKAAIAILLASAATVLAFVFAFLICQVGLRVENSWYAFLVMVMTMLCVDAAIAYALNSKLKLLVLIAAVQVVFTLLYVLLGLSLPNFWHPGWLMILAGVAVNIGLLIAKVVVKNKPVIEAEKKLKEETNEDYYTNWD